MLTDKYLHGIPKGSRAERPEGFLKAEQITDKVITTVTRLQEIAQKRGQSTGQLALAWVLRHTAVTSVIIGARNVEQLKENMETLNHLSFTDDEIKKIEEILQA